MSSKPGSLPFVDDSPPGLGFAETPSEATISARVATTKTPQTVADPVSFNESFLGASANYFHHDLGFGLHVAMCPYEHCEWGHLVIGT